MRISPLNTNINFTSGKTKILSDFDGTFMPRQFNHDLICGSQPGLDKEAFRAYFEGFKNYLDNQNNDEKKVELTITTGRNLHEFNYYMQKLAQKGLRVPNPDSLIITNGGDEYRKTGDGDYFDFEMEEKPAFYLNCHEVVTPQVRNMFNSKNLDREKRSKLDKFIVSYSPDEIRCTIKDMLLDIPDSPTIFNPKTHQGMYGYLDNLTLQENLQRISLGKNNDTMDYVSMRDDGGYQVRLTAPVNSKYWDDLKRIVDEISQKYDVEVTYKDNDPETCVNILPPRPSEEYWGIGHSFDIKPKTTGKITILDKFHHAKLEVDKIIKNNSNDLVIVCGDGENDLGMLDLSNYVDDMEGNFDFSKEEYKEQVDNLPIISIFVRNSSKLDDKIYELERNLNFDGKKRFIIVDKEDPTKPNTLLEAIELAQNEYSDRNSAYKEGRA